MGRTVISRRDVEVRTKNYRENLEREMESNFEKVSKSEDTDPMHTDSDRYPRETDDTGGFAGRGKFWHKRREEYNPIQPLVPDSDKFTSRLLKYIPAEVIALYMTLDALIRSSDKIPLGLYWAVFLFGMAGTYVYLWRVEKVTKQAQILISVIAYCVWVFALGGPFVHLGWYQPIYGGLLLPMYTFLVAIIEA